MELMVTKHPLITNYGTNCSIHRWEFGTKQSYLLTGNNVFHNQIGTRNITVLNYQFENLNMFHLQIMVTENEMFLFYASYSEPFVPIS